MKKKERLARPEGEGNAFVLDLMLLGLEGKVQDGKNEHHLGEATRRIYEVARKEGLVRGMGGEVVPKGVDLDEIGLLPVQGQTVVIVFGPFFGRRQFTVKLSARSPGF